MMGMKAINMLSLAKSIRDGFPESSIEKWVSEENHEDIVIKTDIGRVDIKFYPEEGGNQ